MKACLIFFSKKKLRKKMVKLCPIVYNPSDPTTDFCNLVKDARYHDSLFLFNDNFQDRNSRYPGGNSARIRPYTFCNPPRAMGISTGWSSAQGGFKSLDEDARQAIWLCFEIINLILVENPQITRVFYSCDKNNPKSLGYALFRPGSDVVTYIEKLLDKIPSRVHNISISKTALSLMEDMLEKRISGQKSLLLSSDDDKKKNYVDTFRSRKRVREWVC